MRYADAASDVKRELSGFWGTLSGVRWALVGTLAISLAAHGAVAAVFLVPPRAEPRPLDPPPENAGETFELPAPGPGLSRHWQRLQVQPLRGVAPGGGDLLLGLLEDITLVRKAQA